MKPFEIFRPGEHTAMDGTRLAFSERDVRATADAYDPAVHEAPIVVGHPTADAPAYGWVRALSFVDGALVAEPAQVEPAFAEMVREGRYKKVSASFYRPDAAVNPAPGSWSLRHVGFLGAQPPAVKGLKSIELGGSSDGCVTVEFGEVSGWLLSSVFRRLRDFMIAEFGAEKAEQALPGDFVESMQMQAAMPDATVAPAAYQETDAKDEEMTTDQVARAAAIEAAEAQVEADRKALAEERRAFAETKRRDEALSFVDGLVAAGRLLPRDRDGTATLLACQPSETRQFAEGAETTAGAFLRDLLSRLPVQVEFRELAAGDTEELPVGADGEQIAKAALEYQQAQRLAGTTVDIDAAVRHVTQRS